MKVTLALKVLFSVGITNSKNCVHLRLRTWFHEGFQRSQAGGGAGGISLQHHSLFSRKWVREIYEQCEICGQASGNFTQSSIKEQKDFLAC